jgi:hypothetical protein
VPATSHENCHRHACLDAVLVLFFPANIRASASAVILGLRGSSFESSRSAYDWIITSLDVRLSRPSEGGSQLLTRPHSPVAGRFSRMPDLIGIPAGSLDDPSWHKPTMDMFTSSAQPWDYMNPDLPKLPREPS